jgi:putative phosphoserine phosphatase/1-acylglycerol-3-phosphate O-acyltransferase
MQVAFVDRADHKKAVEALAPAVEALRSGTSLAIAPEGTRSETERLLPFKKGPFHIAMQAGVPMVPVVIHNAIESQPKGTKLFRPATVRVEVLPPIYTGDWRVETIDRHVADVRGRFLRALGQDEEAAPKSTRRKPAGKRPVAKKSRRPARRRTDR